jgi:pseudouridine-5'-phosphate glycosidase/sugar/nucleoside kinase (ribokinase family)
MFTPRQLPIRRHQFKGLQWRLFSSFRVYPAVEAALKEGRPVVALESTIVAHGMPFPQNLELSQKLASILREKGVEPATIALHKGDIKIGLHPDELHELAESGDAAKCTTRQLGLFLANQKGPSWGATTVASTMLLAHQAGIQTFVTGGIGGVHRYGQDTLDISADLLELSRTPVIVVSAGIKSILDISRTLEVLESYSVPVVTYQSNEFPAFFSPHSGVVTPARCDTAAEIAAAFSLNQETFGLRSGMLVAVPNSSPAGEAVEAAIQNALAEAADQGISGPAVTPFILKRVAQMTAGESLRSNMALMENNVAVGADIAIELAHQKRGKSKGPSISRGKPRSRVVVMGGSGLDYIAKPTNDLIIGTSNATITTESDGGVARNIAETLGRLGSRPTLYTAVGADARGSAMLSRLKENNCEVVAAPAKADHRTPTYLAVLNRDGDLHIACADMDAMTSIEPLDQSAMEGAEILIIDSNPPLNVLQKTARLAYESGVKVLWEPTSVRKASILSQDDKFLSYLSYATPNLDELLVMDTGDAILEKSRVCEMFSKKLTSTEILALLSETMSRVVNRMDNWACLVVTLGKNGIAMVEQSRHDTSLNFSHFLADDIVVANATGAGDSLTGAFVHAILLGKTPEEAVRLGAQAARLSLECSGAAVSPEVNQLVIR